MTVAMVVVWPRIRWEGIFCLLLTFVSLPVQLRASAGDLDSTYKVCVQECEESGCVGEKCFQQCKNSSNGEPVVGRWNTDEPLYRQWKHWDCRSDCRYHCMQKREEERRMSGSKPLKYHGKWPFQRIYGIQEPVSVVFSVMNLAIQFHGWISFVLLLSYKLPSKPNRKPYYEYASLWHIYAALAMNSWLWSAFFHCRDVELTERLDYSSAIALLGFSLVLSLLRAFDVKNEATRVIISAPIISFVATHISFLNFYAFDYGLNMKVCVTMGIAQLLIWAIWAGMTRHPSRVKLWVVVIGGALAMLLEIFDFPPYYGYVDAHALWHAATVPLSYLWWSFVRDDAEFAAANLQKSAKKD